MRPALTAFLAVAAISSFALAQPAMLVAAPIETPTVVIHLDRHDHYASKFEIIRAKNAFWRSEVNKKGIDIAYTEWMQQDHPTEFANVCIKHANDVTKDKRYAGLKSEFDGVLNKHPELRAQVNKEGYNTAFVKWLLKNHPTWPTGQ